MCSLARWLRKALPHGGPSVCVPAGDWQDLRSAETPFLARKSNWAYRVFLTSAWYLRAQEPPGLSGPRNH
jgi:hypothetical protein